MNDEGLLKLLDNIALEHGFKKYNINIKPVSTEGANYSSALFSVTIVDLSETEKQHGLNLFAKKLTVGEQVREQAGENAGDNEIHFYKHILPVFKRLELHNNVPIEYRLKTPKFYGNDPSYLNEIIVMEDMSASGYTTFNRFTTVDWNYATVALRELAKWHALSITFEKAYPDDYKKYTENKEMAPAIATKMNTMVDSSVEGAIDVIKESNRDKVRKLLMKYRENKVNYYEDFNKPLKFPVLIHGDYRPSNLVHKDNDDGSYSITILDFQTLRIGSLASDLVYFIVTSTDEIFRKINYERLIDYYYAELGLSLKRLNIDIANVYPRDYLDYELKEILPLGLMWAMFLLPVITVNLEDVPVINKIEDMSVPMNPLFTERINGLVNDFVKWGLL